MKVPFVVQKPHFLLKKILFISIAFFMWGLVFHVAAPKALADNYFITLTGSNYKLGQQSTVSWSTTEYVSGLSSNVTCQLSITNQPTGGSFTVNVYGLSGSYTFTPTGTSRYLANIYCANNPNPVHYCSAGGFVWISPWASGGCGAFGGPPGPYTLYEDGSAFTMADQVGPVPTATPTPTLPPTPTPKPTSTPTPTPSPPTGHDTTLCLNGSFIAYGGFKLERHVPTSKARTCP